MEPEESKRPVRQCALCHEERELCNSHLMPKGTYRILRSKVEKNPNPVMITRGRGSYTTSKQIVDYLLCEECERRFHERGEDWVLKNCYRDANTFSLRDVLRRNHPLSEDGELLVYPTAQIAEIDTKRLIYFAMSVFWRAGAHSWPWQGETIELDFGPYLEPIRKFLLDEQSFPDHMALYVRVVTAQTLLSTSRPPMSANHNGAHSHHFAMPGIAFILAVGQRLLRGTEISSTAPCPEGYITIYSGADESDIAQLRYLKEAADRRGSSL
jgi:hypothetical protein